MKSNFEIGFVYVLSNESMPGLVKIGLTTRLPEDRSHELSNTSVPTPFKVAFRIATSRPREVEKQAHNFLAEYRINHKREFFEVSVETAIESVRRSAIDVSGIDSWKSDVAIKIREGDRVSLSLEAGQVFALVSYPNIFSEKPEIVDVWQAHSDSDQLELYCVDSTEKVSACSSYHPYSDIDPVPYIDRDKNVVNGMINGREVLVSGDRLVWIPAMYDEANQKRVIFEAQNPVQVISRTWSPKIGGHGLPLLMNDFLYNSVWPEAQKAIHDVFDLGLPRVWAPRQNRRPEWEQFGNSPQPSEYWLPQLAPRAKKKKRQKA